jgi:hypothetical protein
VTYREQASQRRYIHEIKMIFLMRIDKKRGLNWKYVCCCCKSPFYPTFDDGHVMTWDNTEFPPISHLGCPS